MEFLKSTLLSGIAIVMISASPGCKKDSATTNSTTTTTGTATVPAIYSKIYGASSITSDGTYITIKTAGVPDHKSIYWPTSNALYATFSGTTFGGYTFSKNPNTITTQTLTFKIPVNPVVSSTHAATPFGPIGVAVNGVAFFNQYAANYAALTTEAFTLDQYWAHPQQSGQYHYHVEPLYLTQTKLTSSSLLGFLLDGFPVYGPTENGKLLTSADLDAYHGHTTVTADFPNGIYHYHFTADYPYLNGNGFYGTSGTVSQ
jgi:hypothetical protein